MSQKQKAVFVIGCVVLLLLLVNYGKLIQSGSLPASGTAGNVPMVLSALGDGKKYEVLGNRLFMDGNLVMDLPRESLIGGMIYHEQMLYLGDCQRKKVLKIDPAAAKAVWESAGEGQFVLPNLHFPLAFDPAGQLWAANTGKKQLEELDPATGRFIAKWEPRPEFAFLGCCDPVGLFALSGGRFISVEKGTGKIRLFAPSGDCIKVLLDDWDAKKMSRYQFILAKDVFQVFFDGQKIVETLIQ